jgi:hypothetical protein
MDGNECGVVTEISEQICICPVILTLKTVAIARTQPPF